MFLLLCASLILLMYFFAGISKFNNFFTVVNGFKQMFYFKTLPNIFYKLSILLVVLLEIFAPLIILFSLLTNKYKLYAYYSSISLSIFTILATLIYHFPPYGSQYYAFIKNLAATGGLLLLSEKFL